MKQTPFLALFGAVCGLVVGQSRLAAQQALVYCPVGIDVTGCDLIVEALAGVVSPFPGGVARAYSGTSGTIDLASADLTPYAVLIVPSLADNGDTKPYDLLRTTAVAERLRTVLRGRIAVWSGTPDQGTTNRPEKSTLIRNLAVWGAANYATSGLRGLVVLQDHSDSVAQRYAWLAGVSRLSVAADSDLQIYNVVQALTAIAAEILRNGDQQLAYANMASFGLQAPLDSVGAAADARGGAAGGQVVLVSSVGKGNGAATVKTDKNDYAPGEVVTISGSGWQPGEIVTLQLHEDLDHDEDTDQTLTTTADSSGSILHREFAPDEHDLGVRFYLTATGQSSGSMAQTTFLDSPKVGSVTVGAQSPNPVTLGSSAAYTITVFRGSGGGSSGNFTATLSITTPLPAGASASFSVNPVSLASAENSKTSTLTISTTLGSTPAGTTSFTVKAATSVSDSATGTGTLTVNKKTPTVTFTGAPASAAYQSSFTVASTTNSSASPVYTSGGGCSNVGPTYTMTSGTATCTSTVTWAADAAYNGATLSQSTTATKLNPTVTFTGAPVSAGFQSTFSVASTTNSSASPVYTSSGGCSNVGTTYTMTSGTATCTSTVTWAADANFTGGTLSQSTTATKANPTVTFTGAPASAAYQSTFTVASSTTSLASPAYTSSGVCSNAGPTYTMTSGTGSCTSTVTWAADDNYTGATRSQTTTAAKIDPTVTFTGAPASAAYQSTFTLATTTNSSTSPAYTSSGVCSNAGPTYTMTSGTGSCTATVTWAADANYTGATRSQTTTAEQITPTVTFTGAAASAAYQSTLTVASTTNSSASPVYTAGGVCSNLGTVYTMTSGTGSCTATVTWAADANYTGATRSQTTTAEKITPTVTFTGAPASAAYLSTFTVASTTNSSASPVYTSSGVCSNAGPTYTMTSGTGSCTSSVTWAADDNYTGATRSQTTAAEQIDPTVTFTGAPASAAYLSTFTVASGTTSSASPVYTSSGVCSNAGPTYTMTSGTGSCTATVTWAADANYTGATLSQSTTATKLNPTVTFTGAPASAAYHSSFAVASTTNSSASPVYTAGGVCSNLGTVYTMTSGTGSCTATVTWAADANYNGGSRSQTTTALHVNLTITANNKTKQYSDPLPPLDVTYSGFVPGEGSGVLGGTLSCTTTATALSAPSIYPITCSGQTSGNYAIRYYSGTLTVVSEDARAYYTGALFASTFGSTSTSAMVTLATTIKDITALPGDPAYDAYGGDTRNATVTFVNRDMANATLCTSSVGPVSLSDTQTGTATCNWSANIGAQNSASYTVGIIVSGSYIRNSSDDDQVVTVSKPLDNFVTGGGFLIMSSSSSGGLYASAPGSKNNFGFNIKYNKNGTNLQGNINVIVRSGGRVYQIKGNSMTSLYATVASGTATFNGKASIQDITDQSNPLSVEGNATLQVDMTDMGEPGSSDQIAITVWNKSGGLWFASDWNGTKTVQQNLAGGNLVVH